MVVTAPARALWQITFEHLINDRKGISNQRIIGRAHAEPDQLEKIPADDVPGVMLSAGIGNLNQCRIGIGSPIGLLRRDANIMPGFAFHEFALVGDCPLLKVSGQPVRVGEQKIRCDYLLPFACKFCGTSQTGNDCRQRRR